MNPDDYKNISPDTLLELYNKGLEAGRVHSKPSSGTIQMIADLEKRISNEIDDKVSWKTFSWILAVLMSMVVGLFSVIYAKMENIDASQRSTSNSVAQIQGILKNAIIE